MKRMICSGLLLSFMFTIPSFTAAQQAGKREDIVNPLYEKKGDRERIYRISFDRMWDACIQIAKDRFNVTFINRDEGILNFESGQKFTSNPFRYGVSLSKVDDSKSKITVNVQNKGWGGLLSGSQRSKRVKEFFSSLDENLSKRQ